MLRPWRAARRFKRFHGFFQVAHNKLGHCQGRIPRHARHFHVSHAACIRTQTPAPLPNNLPRQTAMAGDTGLRSRKIVDGKCNLSFGPAGRWNNVLPQQRAGMRRITSRVRFRTPAHGPAYSCPGSLSSVPGTFQISCVKIGPFLKPQAAAHRGRRALSCGKCL
jgi:hypothetical protein